jgi:hypothetical protein
LAEAAWRKRTQALQALRKEYGSVINAKYDLVTAKELLRHSSVAITAAHYVENRKGGTTGLGAVLATKPKGKKIVAFNDAAKAGKRNPSKTSGVRQSHVINQATV